MLCFLPEMIPSFVCLENSYSYDKAQLSCYFSAVFLDSAKQIV